MAEHKLYLFMKEKWPDAKLIYVAVHKLGSRDIDTQEKLREIQLAACLKHDVKVADIYKNEEIDTTNVNNQNAYTFNELGNNGLPGKNGSGTHPNLDAIEKFYVPVVSETLRNEQFESIEIASGPDKTKYTIELARVHLRELIRK